MRIIVALVIAAPIGLLAAYTTDHMGRSSLPPCSLVERGIGISTYGCSNEISPHSSCIQRVPKSSAMTDCIEHNYYVLKTFPFGFVQHFDPGHNLEQPNDSNVRSENRVSTFLSVATIVIVIVIVGESARRTRSVRQEHTPAHQ
jgi:hypothetical protein